MKNLYNIKDKKGIHIFYQVAKSEKEALDSANMRRINRHPKPATATFVREHA